MVHSIRFTSFRFASFCFIPFRFRQFFLSSIGNLLLLFALLLLLPQDTAQASAQVAAQAGTHQYDPYVCYGISDERSKGNPVDNTLLKIDPATGTVSEIGLTFANSTETIALGPNSSLYGVEDKWFGEFNTTSGVFVPMERPIGNIEMGETTLKINDVDSLAYNPNQPDLMMAVFRRMDQPDLLFAIHVETGQIISELFDGQDHLVLQDSHLQAPLLDIDDLLFDFGPDGSSPPKLLGLANNRGKGSTLVTIDMESGVFNRIGIIKSQANLEKTIEDIEGFAFWNANGLRKLIGSTGENVDGNQYGNRLFEIHYASASSASDPILATELFKFDGPAIDVEGLACASLMPDLIPNIDIEKATSGPGQVPEDADIGPGPYIKVGDQVTWSYVVRNSGEIALQNVQVTDDKEGVITCPQSTLQVNESMTCVATGMAVAGDYVNMSTVVGTPIDGQPDVTDSDPSHYHARTARVDIEKTTNGPGQAPQDADSRPGPYIREGLQVTWSYVVSNIGQLDLQNVQVTDDKEGHIQCPQDRLAVGESMTCIQSGTATLGQYANNSIVTASPVDGSRNVTDTDPSHYYGTRPAVDIEKFTNGAGQAPEDADNVPGPTIEPGYPVYWTYLVTNIGNIDLTNVVVTDDKVATIFCPQSTLDIDESMTCRASGVAAVGQYENIGKVSGLPVDGSAAVNDEDPSHYFGEAAAVKLEKSSTMDWTYTVTNTGGVPLSNLVFHASNEVIVNCFGQSDLSPGENISCPASGPEAEYAKAIQVTAKSVDEGTEVTATVAATPIDTVRIAIALNEAPIHSFQAAMLPVGQQAFWTYTLTNKGSTTLQNITARVKGSTVSDNEGESLACPTSELPAGESVICTATRAVTVAEQNQVIVVQGVEAESGTPVRTEDVVFYHGYDHQEIGGLVYNADQPSGNGVSAASPKAIGLSGMPVSLYDSDGNKVNTLFTDPNGTYRFTQLEPGDYYLLFDKFSGLWEEANQGVDENLDNDAVGEWAPDPNQARTHYFRINPEGQLLDQTWDAGIMDQLQQFTAIYLPLVNH
ncbi:MAG: SdrD B-like domain-containing protein [Chloroflexota bacterium]